MAETPYFYDRKKEGSFPVMDSFLLSHGLMHIILIAVSLVSFLLLRHWIYRMLILISFCCGQDRNENDGQYNDNGYDQYHCQQIAPTLCCLLCKIVPQNDCLHYIASGIYSYVHTKEELGHGKQTISGIA